MSSCCTHPAATGAKFWWPVPPLTLLSATHLNGSQQRAGPCSGARRAACHATAEGGPAAIDRLRLHIVPVHGVLHLAVLLSPASVACSVDQPRTNLFLMLAICLIGRPQIMVGTSATCNSLLLVTSTDYTCVAADGGGIGQAIGRQKQYRRIGCSIGDWYVQCASVWLSDVCMAVYKLAIICALDS